METQTQMIQRINSKPFLKTRNGLTELQNLSGVLILADFLIKNVKETFATHELNP